MLSTRRYRFVTAVFPSSDDDVVTSPYNAMLAMNQLTQHADCVLPVENEALADICAKIDKGKQQRTGRNVARAGSAISDAGAKRQLPWDAMNNVVAHSLLHLTSGSRFDGSLNIDVNEITMNLVPFPQLHYLISSLTPLYALSDVSMAPRKLDQMFSDAFSPDFQLTKTNPRHGAFLACALMVRGDVEVSDIRRNIARLRPSLKFVPWNREGWKTGLCATPPLTQDRSLLTLSNSTCIGASFSAINDRFVKLYRSKAYVHHFTSEGMELSEFAEAQTSCADLVAEYGRLEQQALAPDEPPPPRLKVA
jgi:tubulin epsilon